MKRKKSDAIPTTLKSPLPEIFEGSKKSVDTDAFKDALKAYFAAHRHPFRGQYDTHVTEQEIAAIAQTGYRHRVMDYSWDKEEQRKDPKEILIHPEKNYPENRYRFNLGGKPTQKRMGIISAALGYDSAQDFIDAVHAPDFADRVRLHCAVLSPSASKEGKVQPYIAEFRYPLSAEDQKKNDYVREYVDEMQLKGLGWKASAYDDDRKNFYATVERDFLQNRLNVHPHSYLSKNCHFQHQIYTATEWRKSKDTESATDIELALQNGQKIVCRLEKPLRQPPRIVLTLDSDMFVCKLRSPYVASMAYEAMEWMLKDLKKSPPDDFDFNALKLLCAQAVHRTMASYGTQTKEKSRG